MTLCKIFEAIISQRLDFTSKIGIKMNIAQTII